MNTNIARSLLSVLFLFCAAGTAHAASSKDAGSEVVERFRAGEYQKIIEIAQRSDQLNELEQLLLAKSYERLGFYHRANRVLKVLYNANAEFKDFIPLFIGHNYERLEDYYNALKWYRLTVSSKVEDTDVEKKMIFINVLERVAAIGEKDPRSLGQCVKVMKRSRKPTPLAVYYLGRLYEGGGDRKGAARYYSKAIGSEQAAARKKALERVAEDKELIRELDHIGLGSAALLELLVEHELWDSALSVAYLLPENRKVAEIRALCHYRNRDYETAEVLYSEYYGNYSDPAALKKLAYSSYYNGKRDLSYQYINQYISLEQQRGEYDIEARSLKHSLESSRLDLDSHLRNAAQLVRNRGEPWKNDWIIQEAFYRTAGDQRYDAGVAFVKENYRYLGSPLGRAWAMFMLGIYDDESYLEKAVTLYPGSYYYFRAARRIETDGDLLSRADRYYTGGKREKALQLYVQLYSRGYKREYLRSRIVSILSTQEQYRPYMQIAWMERGQARSPLFDLLAYGLYDELREIILLWYDWAGVENRMLCNYLLSRQYYETGQIYRGILYAERVNNGSDIDSPLFLPKEILTILYPRVYTEIIKRAVPESSPIPDEYFILAVMREESRYNPRAHSSQGAVGLMQLLPATADWIAGNKVSEAELVDPEKNIMIGVRYLNYLFTKFSSPYHVLAAYNGGPNNVNRWISRYPDSDVDMFTEQIPFPETRNFVKKVMRSYNMYRELYENGTTGDIQ